MNCYAKNDNKNINNDAKGYEICGNSNDNNIKINEKKLKNKCIKNALICQTKINNKIGLKLNNNKINFIENSKITNKTKEKDTFKNNVLLAKLCEQKVEEKGSLKLSEEYIKMNNSFYKENKNICAYIINNNEVNINKNIYKNNDAHKCANQDIYADNYINKNICAKVENDKGVFFDKLNNKADNIKLNKKRLGVNVVNSDEDTQNKKWGSRHKKGNYTRENIKSVPKNITTAIICMWLFVLCACLALVVGVGYSNAKNNNLNVLSNTTTAEGSTFSGGDGTESNPYQIATYADLIALSTTCNAGEHYADKYFVLTDDIAIEADDLDSANSTSSTYWVPIGSSSSSTYFSGHFNGQEHKILISGNMTTGENTYGGVLFGYISSGSVQNVNVVFNTSTDCTITFTALGSSNYWGIIAGYATATLITGCTVSGASVVVTKAETVTGFIMGFGGIVGEIAGDGSTVTNCEFHTSLLYNIGAFYCSLIVGSDRDVTSISNCKVVGNFTTIDNSWYCGTILGVGLSSEVSNCTVEGTINMESVDGGGFRYMGVIVGRVKTIKNCYAKIDSATFKASGMDGSYIGLVAGYATTIENCYVEANMVKFCCYDGDGDTSAGLVAGKATTINNCFVNATIGEVDAGDSTSKPFKYIAGFGTANNCIIIADISTISSYYNETLTGYNCVVVGGITESSDTTKGLYVISSDNENLSELKKAATYSGTGANGFTWNTTDGTAWNFDDTWTIINEGKDYPRSQMFMPEKVNVTLNITINGGTVNNAMLNQSIIYRFDESGNVVNQFVVTNGNVITFETGFNKPFTIMINYKLFMTTTIDGESVAQKTYTPTSDTDISITITAPSGVNNWIVI